MAEQQHATALGMRIPIPVTMGDQFDVKIQPDTSCYLFALSTPTTFVFATIDEAMAFHQRFGKAVMEHIRTANLAATGLEASPEVQRQFEAGPGFGRVVMLGPTHALGEPITEITYNGRKFVLSLEASPDDRRPASVAPRNEYDNVAVYDQANGELTVNRVDPAPGRENSIESALVESWRDRQDRLGRLL